LCVIEYARSVCEIVHAHSLEFDEKSPDLVVDLLEDQKNVSQK
jgi:CTP synthase